MARSSAQSTGSGRTVTSDLLAFVASEAREFAGLLRHLEAVSRLDWPLDYARSARLNGEPIILVANGPGPKLAAKAAEVAKEHHILKGLVSIGFCGALSPALNPAEIFVATVLLNVTDMLHAPVAHALSVPRSHSCERLGPLLSTDHVAATAQEKQSLHHQFQADAIEMESAGVAAAAAEGCPVYAVKVVTDTASESFPLNFNLLRDAEGRFSRPKILQAALRRPAAFPALINLNRRCTQAAQVLGDFLADARF
jgi:adenosylhomocysteine nucleosidase